MQYFNFKRLINKYMTDFTAIIPNEPVLNDYGDYEKGVELKITLKGAIISMRESRVIRSEGVYTQQDRALYMLNPLDNALQGAKIIHKGNLYRLGDKLDNANFTGVYAYTLKYVSAFDKAGDNVD